MLTEQIFQKILNKSNTKNISLKRVEECKYLIDKNDTDRFLKILFKVLTKNKICFTILRDEFELIKIDIFEKQKETPRRYFIYTTPLDEISNGENQKYKQKIRVLKRRRIFPVIGPDGVGKTTLLKQFMNNIEEKISYIGFKKIVRRSILYNIIHPISKNLLKFKMKQKPLKDQHDDIYYFLIFIAGILHYPYLLYTTIFRKKTIIIDRFFNDYILENISFKEKKTVLRDKWKNLSGVIPKVFWFIHLDAKPKVILNRKDELTKHDIKQYKRLNFKIYLYQPSVVYTYINTELDIEHCENVLNYTYHQLHKITIE